ncbi:MAG: 30S ribosomal protein S4 [Halobacteriovoraceae bacterium]|jgi:small subunit ribosomal protein S4|nr:30S ribosomal protein S4 [Halobacteriovoraceae bacterium]|tara:strand:- start:26 stop:646 length:621 start_codon:yes stop_codon:yes gene_type:complete
MGKKSAFKIQRRLGIELPGLGKAGALERRPYGPGMHGMKRKKLSDYTIRLMEKQKVRYHYGVREGQLRNLVIKCKKDKSRSWVDSLIISLESRLDNVVFRSNWAPSIAAARQMVSHGHISINGVKTNIASALVKPGDVVTIADKGAKSGNYLQAKARPRLSAVPAFLKVEQDGEKEKVSMVASPLPEDIPFAFEKRLVIEYYWKLK